MSRIQDHEGRGSISLAPTLAQGEEREDGVVLTDLSLRPIAVDSGAIAILSDINRRGGLSALSWSIPREVADGFMSVKNESWRDVRVSLRGEKYEYICTMYQTEPQNDFLPGPLLAMFLQRVSSPDTAILQIAAQCGLTPREIQVLRGIAVGLTSKEVAQSMKISPNTVKTYLRLIMVKMGVTTRAAIVGTLLNHNGRGGQSSSAARFAANP
jgi:DNA-binding CsgD family transcriptional regulator